MGDWEPYGEPGMGGYTWGRKPDGEMGFVPGGVNLDEQPLIGVDVGGMVHIDPERGYPTEPDEGGEPMNERTTETETTKQRDTEVKPDDATRQAREAQEERDRQLREDQDRR